MKKPKRYSLMEDYMDEADIWVYYQEDIDRIVLNAEKENSWTDDSWDDGSFDDNSDDNSDDIDGYDDCTSAVISELSADIGVAASKLGWLYSTWKTWNQWYKVYTIPKRHEGFRVISAPQGLLLSVQRAINENVLSKFKYLDCCHGFRKEHSILTNAAPHANQDLIIKVDIKDFFQSISACRVYGIFKKIGYNTQSARFLTRLCTYNGVLPQGAPTSPALANRICQHMDKRIQGLIIRNFAEYTRYADDITVSGFSDIVRLLPLIKHIIYDEGFVVAENKVRVCRRNMRQQVTGLTVNDGVKIPRDIKKRIRAMIHATVTARRLHFENNDLSGKAFRGYVSYLHFIDSEYSNKAWDAAIRNSVNLEDKE